MSLPKEAAEHDVMRRRKERQLLTWPASVMSLHNECIHTEPGTTCVLYPFDIKWFNEGYLAIWNGHLINMKTYEDPCILNMRPGSKEGPFPSSSQGPFATMYVVLNYLNT